MFGVRRRSRQEPASYLIGFRIGELFGFLDLQAPVVVVGDDMNDVDGLAVQVQAERVREIKSIAFISIIGRSRLAADDNPFDRTHRRSEIPLVGISRSAFPLHTLMILRT